MKRWGIVSLMLFAFVVGFASTYSCSGGGGSSSNAADYAPLVHEHSAADVTSGVLDLSLIPSHSHPDYALSDHSHTEYMGAIECLPGEVLKWDGDAWICASDLDSTDAETLDGNDSSDFASSNHSHTDIQEISEAICFLSRATGKRLTGYNFQGNCFQRVFVTSTYFLGDFMDVTGGDIICQSLAEAANLQGTYKAWLASEDDFKPDPNMTFIKSPYPYILVDGTVIANNWEDLTDGTLLNPIILDENGQTITTYPSVWTNVAVNGWSTTRLACSGMCCSWLTNESRYVGNIGSIFSTTATWTAGGEKPCNEYNRLYCFQQ